MRNIEYEIAKTEAEYLKYKYKRIGAHESLHLLCNVLMKKGICISRRAAATLWENMPKSRFRHTYDKKKQNIVISITSTRDRIKGIFPTLYSLMAQNRKPDFIVLWLGKEKDYPPKIIHRIKEMGISIHYCKDIGPHTKYYYSFKKFKSDLLLTVDDDIIYHKNMVDELYRSYQENRDMVIARRVHKMRFDYNKELLAYKKWIWEYTDSEKPAFDLFATGVGGVLYPPSVMTLECWNNKDFLTVCPKADDIWLKFCELQNGIMVYPVKESKYCNDIVIVKTTKNDLSKINVDEGKNDDQIIACMDYFDMKTDFCDRIIG